MYFRRPVTKKHGWFKIVFLNSLMKNVDEKIIFINIFDLCKMN